MFYKTHIKPAQAAQKPPKKHSKKNPRKEPSKIHIIAGNTKITWTKEISKVQTNQQSITMPRTRRKTIQTNAH
jgi:hypothetical protein